MEEQNTSQTATKSKHKKWIIIAGLLVCIAGIALFFGLSKDKKENIILTVGDYSYNPWAWLPALQAMTPFAFSSSESWEIL